MKRKQILTVNGIHAADNRYHIIVHISIDLTFDSFKYDRATQFLKLENCGDVAIDLSFEKIEAQSTATTSFFFDKFPFRIIPREVLEMPFHFYPTETGLFCEKWKLNCEPHFTYDHQIVINLIGICKRKHKIEDEVAKLEAEITRKAAHLFVRQEIKSIIDLSIPKCCEEDRLSSAAAIDPIEMKFNAMNPKLTYCPSIVERMSQLHHRINASDQWNYDIESLYGHIMNIHDNDELQKELYRQFNDAYGKLLRTTSTSQKQSEDDKIVKIAMIKCLFGQFFDRFETEMEANADDQLNSIAKKFATTINKMISILES